MATCIYSIVLWLCVYGRIYNTDIVKIVHEDYIAAVFTLKRLGESSVYLLASCVPVGNLH